MRVQADEMTLEEAGAFQAKWTPRGWSRARDEPTAFEQLLCLRQPGCGAGSITGKLLFDRLLTESSQADEQAGRRFDPHGLVDRLESAGMVPTTVIMDDLRAG